MSLGTPQLAGHPAASGPGWGAVRRSAFLIDRSIGLVTEAVGAALVLAEIVILFAGVVSRYGFGSPIFWTDELAAFLFLWLAMLGAVVALRRGDHMRLTTLVARAGPGGQAFWSAVASL